MHLQYLARGNVPLSAVILGVTWTKRVQRAMLSWFLPSSCEFSPVLFGLCSCSFFGKYTRVSASDGRTQCAGTALRGCGTGPGGCIEIPCFELFPSLLPWAVPWAPLALSHVGRDSCPEPPSIYSPASQHSLQCLILCCLQAHSHCPGGCVTFERQFLPLHCSEVFAEIEEINIYSQPTSSRRIGKLVTLLSTR